MSLVIGLVGNPNSGKTTVFNALTGARQKVGNWPGVTVERKSGFFNYQNERVEVVDLPGTYSLTCASMTSAIDEKIACDYILSRQADFIINILDASNLERNLYLTTQLLEMRVPVLIAVNMMDVARDRRMRVAVDVLEKKLGCPVVALEAHKNKGIKELKQKIVSLGKSLRPSAISLSYPAPIERAITEIAQQLSVQQSDSPQINQAWVALRLLEDDVLAQACVDESIMVSVKAAQHEVRRHLNEDADILLADARYHFIRGVVEKAVEKNADVVTWTTRIDHLVLNRIAGIPIFLSVMYGMFLFAINIGGAFQDFFDISSNTIFVDGLAELLTRLHIPNGWIAFFANGVGKGINTTITFIPVIGAMFFALSFLEDSGYMARAAFVVDRLMRALGLPGKSFVPMIVGFGCNVPAVMAARTLDNQRDRILTVMMSPFMSCGARLAIFAVFTAAFFPVGGQNIVFALYVIGIVAAMITGFSLRKTFLKGEPAPLVMELPPYHVPHLRTLCLHAWQRLKGFVFRAGKLIIPLCILLGMLNALNMDGTLNSGEGSAHSLLSTVGQWLTPVFTPLGIHQDNWPATVGLVTGVLAKEVVIGTLNTIYSQIGHFAQQADTFHFWSNLQEACASIPANLLQLGSALGNPVLAKAPVHTLNQGVYGLLYQQFDGQVGAMAYLLFVLLYLPCVSTTAAMIRELNWRWAMFSVGWATLIAYGVSVSFYQIATFARHPFSSSAWVSGILFVFLIVMSVMRWMSSRHFMLQRGQHGLA